MLFLISLKIIRLKSSYILVFFSKVKFRPTTGTLNLGYVFELLDFLDLISITIYSLNILMIVIKIKLKIQNIFYKVFLNK